MFRGYNTDPWIEERTLTSTEFGKTLAGQLSDLFGDRITLPEAEDPEPAEESSEPEEKETEEPVKEEIPVIPEAAEEETAPDAPVIE